MKFFSLFYVNIFKKQEKKTNQSSIKSSPKYQHLDPYFGYL